MVKNYSSSHIFTKNYIKKYNSNNKLNLNLIYLKIVLVNTNNVVNNNQFKDKEIETILRLKIIHILYKLEYVNF